ncbi:MAG: tetratricopeptide repeat protein [Planctomycetota bacterium]
MDVEQYRRSKEAFLAVCERPEPEWPAVIAEVCGQDQGLRAEVERLLAADRRTRASWDQPGAVVREQAEAVLRSDLDPGPSRVIPDRIGAYTVVGWLGEGGMGVVYEAEQAHPRRRVAIKVLRRSLITPGVRRRFEREAEVLGQLQHPGIARIFEAGTDADGSPFMAMEFVSGVPLGAYLQREQLSHSRRLELMAAICDAVDHAHRKGILHRDLKPSNVLVERSGTPRVLDFGVARVLDTDGGATQHTESGQLIGTLPYMSPEQAAGGSGVDVRSDVYALGVMLYEVLAGHLPYPILGQGLIEAVRIIREVEPERLGVVDRRFRGDLETIAAKALEKDADRRYASAAELAADLRRSLRDEPIVARPPSAIYQLSKFARRNRALVTAAAAALVTLLVGFVGIAFALEAERAQRKLAEQRLQRAEAAEQLAETRRLEAELQGRVASEVNGFLNDDLLAALDPFNGPGGSPISLDTGGPGLLQRALDAATSRLEGRFAEEPAAEAEIRLTLARGYMRLSQFASAEPQILRAIEILSALFGGDDEWSQKAWYAQAELCMATGRLDDADRIHAENQARAARFGNEVSLLGRHLLANLRLKQARLTEAVAAQRAVHQAIVAKYGADDRRVMVTQSSLAMALQEVGQYEEAEQLLRASLAARERLDGEDDLDTATNRINLAVLLIDVGRLDEAEPLLLAARDRFLTRVGPDHVHTLTADSHRVELLRQQRRYEAAEALARDLLLRAASVLGEGHPLVSSSAQLLGDVLISAARPDEALPFIEQAWRHREASLGSAHPNTMSSLIQRCVALRALERDDEAEKILRELADRAHTHLGPRHRWTIRARHLLAEILSEQQRYEEELPLREAVLAARWERDGAETLAVADARHDLGYVLLRRERPHEAREQFEAALATRRDKAGAAQRVTRQTLLGLARAQLACGDERGELASRRELVELERGAREPSDEYLWRALRSLARAEAKVGTRETAVALYEEELELRRRHGGETTPETLDATRDVARALASAQHFERADAILQRGIAESTARRGADDLESLRCRGELARLRRDESRFDEAASMARSVYDAMVRTVGPRHASTRLTARILATIHDGLGDPEAAGHWRELGE